MGAREIAQGFPSDDTSRGLAETQGRMRPLEEDLVWLRAFTHKNPLGFATTLREQKAGPAAGCDDARSAP
jgi:hypothetical protein